MSVIGGSAVVGAGGYTIANSLRLRSSASASLSTTSWTVGGTPTKMTFSAWAKRGTLGAVQNIRQTYYDANTSSGLFFDASDRLQYYNYQSAAYTVQKVSTDVFRDPSAWYHIVLIVDTTLATAEDRFQIWVNNRRITSWSTNTNTHTQSSGQILGYAISGATQYIGRSFAGSYLDGYVAEIVETWQTAKSASDFGQTDTNGVWVPKAYSGTYGTYGFYLKFNDGSNTTNLCLDRSGNGNNWTPSGISVTAGVTYDWATDSPTNLYCTLNPLNAGVAPTDGNLKITGATAHRNVLGTINLPASGLFYFEGFAPAIQRISVGIATSALSLTAVAAGQTMFRGCYGDSGGLDVKDGATTLFSQSAVAANDVFQIAVDCSTGKMWFGRNNTWYNSTGSATGNPAAGTNQTWTISGITDYAPELGVYDASSNSHINFGQRPFTYTPPTGFKALCSANLPAVTIANPKKHFDVVTYAGSASQQTISTGLTALEWAWIKRRSGTAASHSITDIVRGNGGSGNLKTLYSDLTAAEDNTSPNYNPSSFSGSGIVLPGAATGINNTSETYVLWGWKANGAGVTNTAGSITSTVSANTTAGFSIVTYTGTGANATVGHGLGAAPKMVIVKNRGGATGMIVQHASLSAGTQFLQLSQTTGSATDATMWNSTFAGGSVFSVGSNSNVNTNGNGHVAYCFAEVPGFSKFGSYTGNGSADGPFVYCGFRPRWVLIKNTTAASTDHWVVHDTARDAYNLSNTALYPNLTNADNVTSTGAIDILSNGFKIRENTTQANSSGGTYIFMALAESPFGASNTAPATAR